MLSVLTIVLDGLPFLKQQWAEYQKLTCEWHLAVVEGAAMNTRCTKWCRPQQPRLSNDGTTEFLDSIKSHPNVTVIRRESWQGKVAMCNAGLEQLPPGILVTPDSDELWTADQLERIVDLFDLHPAADRAEFFCNYYVGPQIVTLGERSYGNKPGEWARAWRFTGKERFLTHEPPILAGRTGSLITREETRKQGLVFDHFAYALEKQVAYKEGYYGYKDAVKHWKRLQEAAVWPVRLKDYLPWVDGKASATKEPKTVKPEYVDYVVSTGRVVPPKFLVCLSHHGADYTQAYQMAELIAELESRKRYDVDFALIRHPNATEMHPQTVANLAEKFGCVHLWTSARQDTGYPDGCNGMFIDLAERMASVPMQGRYYAWLNLEPDCMPMDRNWLNQVLAAWKQASARGMLAMGHVKAQPHLHLNGAAVYATDFADRVPLVEKRGWAYDLINAQRILPTSADTPVIGGIWGKPHLRLNEIEAYTKQRGTKVALFHGVKESVAVFELRRKLGLKAAP